MTHCPELDAAAYLAGELTGEARETFENHLLRCDSCWGEVEAGRRGRAAIQSLRSVAPVELRTAIRELVAAQPGGRRTRTRRARVAAGCAVIVMVAASAALAWRASLHGGIVGRAVAGYVRDELPGSHMPKTPAPDLRRLGMIEMGAGAGRLFGMAVDAFAYQDPAGRRVTIYVCASTVTAPPSARSLDGPDGPWMAHVDDVMVLGGRRPHRVLVVGRDPQLVHDAAVALGVM